MSLASALADFRTAVTQCETLIANAHREDTTGTPLFPPLDQSQITVAAFLNLFIASETFIESSLICLMTGEQTLSGSSPTRHVSPPSEDIAKRMIIGPMRFFDYGDHHRVRTVANIYFDQGYPYEPHLTALVGDLNDLKIMRNSSAHISSSTQTTLEGLAIRIFSRPMPGITLYQMLTATDPRSAARNTVFVTYKEKLVVAAGLIVQG
jgi:hypothetical protein